LRSGRDIFEPGNAPYVVSKSKGLMAFQMPWILDGERGITVIDVSQVAVLQEKRKC
jgi:hypothetical protein